MASNALLSSRGDDVLDFLAVISGPLAIYDFHDRYE